MYFYAFKIGLIYYIQLNVSIFVINFNQIMVLILISTVAT